MKKNTTVVIIVVFICGIAIGYGFNKCYMRYRISRGMASNYEKIASLQREYVKAIRCAGENDWNGLMQVFDSATRAEFEKIVPEDDRGAVMRLFVDRYHDIDSLWRDYRDSAGFVTEKNKAKITLTK